MSRWHFQGACQHACQLFQQQFSGLLPDYIFSALNVLGGGEDTQMLIFSKIKICRRLLRAAKELSNIGLCTGEQIRI